MLAKDRNLGCWDRRLECERSFTDGVLCVVVSMSLSGVSWSGRGTLPANAPRAGAWRAASPPTDKAIAPARTLVARSRPVTFTIISLLIRAISIIEYNIKIANLTAIIARCSYGRCPYIFFYYK